LPSQAHAAATSYYFTGYGTSNKYTKCKPTGADEMNPLKMLAIVLIIAGALGLAYGSFSYTKETHETKIGPLDISVKDKETVNVPVWAGVGAIVIGGLLLTIGRKT
jgi:hypothetical protein